MLEAAAVDVECFEDFVDVIRRNARGNRPEDYVKVFLAGLELIEDRVEEISAGNEFALEEAEIAAIEFNPEVLALKMLDPACPQITRPVTFHPFPDAPFAQVVPRFLTFDPFMAVLFLDTRLVDAPTDDRANPVIGSCERIIAWKRAIHGHHLPPPLMRTSAEF